MEKRLLGLAFCLALIGCGGNNGVNNKITFGITEMNGVNYGVSVDAWKFGETNPEGECRDDAELSWCSTTGESQLKEVRFISDEDSHDFDFFELYFKNSSSINGNVRIHVLRGDFVIIDRVVSLSPGQKLRVGTVERDGDFYGVNGF